MKKFKLVHVVAGSLLLLAGCGSPGVDIGVGSGPMPPQAAPPQANNFTGQYSAPPPAAPPANNFSGQYSAPPAVPMPNMPSPAAQARCNADFGRLAIGVPYSFHMEMMLKQQSGATSVRVLKPNDVATMDFDPSRLTLTLDKRNDIAAANCS